MQRSINRATYETRLSQARRALSAASQAAETVGDDGAALDLSEMAAHASVLMQESLKGTKHVPKDQLRLV